MMKRIEISDTRIENATSTLTAELNPPDDLRIDYSDGYAVGSAYFNHSQLPAYLKQFCDLWGSVRKLRIVLEIEDGNEKVSASQCKSSVNSV